VSERLPYGEGVFRRRFALRAEPGRVIGDMEDDFHRFHLVLEHDGARVTDVSGEARRYPWTECPGATEPLRTLVGATVSDDPTGAASHANPRENCTHLFDLASLALTHAQRGSGRRTYDIAIPDRIDGATRATLHRDGAELLSWDIVNTRIRGPEPYAGVSMRGSAFINWTVEHLDPETAEAALALRRASFIAVGRSRNLDDAATAEVYMPLAKGSCYTFTVGIAERAARMKGTTLDFTHHPERLLADLSA
jgi:hypothetical protein